MERVQLTRLRWRLRGAWQWPSFAVLTVVDAALLQVLPLAGGRPDAFAAVVLALFFNLVAVAVAGPLVGLLLRRRRPDLPRVIAGNRGGTVALVATTALLAGIGLEHRPDRDAHRQELAAQSAAVRRFVAHQSDPRLRRNVDRADTIPFGEDLYRTCVPATGGRAYCLFVDTSTSPPGLTHDPNPAPNDSFVAGDRP